MKHSEAPWGYEPSSEAVEDVAYIVFQAHGDGEVIGAVLAPVATGDVEANARLFAGAPDLYHALDQLFAACRDHKFPITAEHMAIMGRAEAALAKVKGPR